MEDTYRTLEAAAIGEYREKGSKFLAYAFPVHTGTEIRNALDTLKKEHFKAHHHCYAYRLGMTGNLYRANDDGEPSGTAGKPILGQIDSAGLTNLLIVVVRYFGGIKLGTSGLTQAYKISARAAIEAGTIVERIMEMPIQLAFDYAQMSEVMNRLKAAQVQIIHQEFNETAKLHVLVRLSEVDAIEQRLSEVEGLSLTKFNELPFG